MTCNQTRFRVFLWQAVYLYTFFKFHVVVINVVYPVFKIFTATL